ncbi:unnamed protein product [Fraxinus pennsylvanica]|uniref:CSC1/OSCA1-like N-terminal transmembrane domain-containing protein n=1 Tax=Fraxinus pennsylvanica TaxID=56036 RepID=A0AAD2AKM4_9LAMI|nr:unnamed protein product [Fraxinus pennsylvanica]
MVFALLKIQPINERIYVFKWYMNGTRTNLSSGGVVGFNFLHWMPYALKMSEDEIISHAGLDSAAFLRIFILCLKIFGLIAIVALVVLILVNVSGGALDFGSPDLVFNIHDKLWISNICPKSYKTNPSSGGVMGFNFLHWMPHALKMSEDEIISHAGLDSAAFRRIFTHCLKIFGLIAIVALVVLILVNVSGVGLDFGGPDLVFNILDKLSISNICPKSYKFNVLSLRGGSRDVPALLQLVPPARS